MKDFDNIKIAPRGWRKVVSGDSAYFSKWFTNLRYKKVKAKEYSIYAIKRLNRFLKRLVFDKKRYRFFFSNKNRDMFSDKY